jgi:hypothetical protein
MFHTGRQSVTHRRPLSAPMFSNKSLQVTSAAPSVLDGVGDSVLLGFVVASFPAPVHDKRSAA